MRWWFLALVVGCNGRTRIEETDTDVDTDDNGGRFEPCAVQEDCQTQLVCSSLGTCDFLGEPGTQGLEDGCFATSDCQLGLLCGSGETCEVLGSAGTADVGQVCTEDRDCQRGLSCYQDTCAGFHVPLFTGSECGEEGGAFRVYFEPSTTRTDDDFYRLPFPTDIRRTAGGIDFTGHPTFEHPAFGDLGARWLAAASLNPGFGPGQGVYFRATEGVAYSVLLPGPLGGGTGIGAVDLTPGATQGDDHPVSWRYRSLQKYICDPWIGAFPPSITPWKSGHTYAVVATTQIEKTNGTVAIPDVAMQSMFSTQSPVDPALLDAWNAMAPLRTSFDAIPLSEVASVASFTVMDVDDAAQAIRRTASGAVAPNLELLHVCTGTPGPLSDPADATRGCGPVAVGFTEIQGRLSVPHIQPGTAPFVLEGGVADWSTGQPQIDRFETVEFSLTIPSEPPPEGGYPVVLYSHGEDGNYRSSVTDQLAGMWSNIQVGTEVAQFATLSIDTWLTGPRGGTVDAAWRDAFAPAEERSLIYANPLRPDVARDNLAQTALDWATVVRWLETVDWADPNSSPTSASVTFDLEALHFVGQDIGALAGPAFVVGEPRVRSVVLAGAGGPWKEVVSAATLPFPPTRMVGPLLGDPQVDRIHPLLNIAQGVVDRMDPVNHAGALVRTGFQRDLLIVHGADDGYVGTAAQTALSYTGQTHQLVQSGLVPLENVVEATAPVSGNVRGRTAVTLLRTGADPHRLLLQDISTRTRVAAFLGSSAIEGIATVP